MTLLEQAKLKYPVGTKFYSPSSGHSFEITECVEWYESFNEVRCCVSKKRWHPYVYHNKKWGEIISTPVPEIINNYPIY